MKEFIVQRPEIHISRVKILANSPEEAFKKVLDGDGDELTCEYAETVEPCHRPWWVANEHGENIECFD